MSLLTTRDLREFFDDATISRGVSYVHQNKVISANIVEQTPVYAKLIGKVAGTNKQKYDVEVDIDFGELNVDAECSCPVGYNCKHAVAVILSASAQQQPVQPKLLNLDEPANYFLNHWIEEVSANIKEEKNSDLNEIIIFILNIEQGYREKSLSVTPATIRKLKKGSLSKAKFYYPSTEHRKVRLTTEMSYAFGLLDLYGEQQGFSKDPFVVTGPYFDVVITALVATQQCYWKTIETPPVELGPVLEVSFSWVIEEDGSQTIKPSKLPDEIELLPTTPLFYYNHKSNQIGEIKHNFPRFSGALIYNFPPVPPTQVKDFVKKMTARLSGLSLPQIFNQVVLETHKPIPSLHLYQRELFLSTDNKARTVEKTSCILAELKFEYAGTAFYSNNSITSFTKIINDTLLQIPRDFHTEREEISFFTDEFYFTVIPEIRRNCKDINDEQLLSNSFLISSAWEFEKLHWFRTVVEPQLRLKGWKINYEKSEIFQSVLEPNEWYINLNDGSGIDWFGLELGIMINNEKIDLLPHLIRALQQSTLTINDNNLILLSIPNKGIVPIPEQRINQIMQVITQMLVYDAKTKTYQVQLDRKKAALLIEIEKAFAAAELRKFGDEKLFEIGKQLTNFTKIKKVSVPKIFSATLRPYQQQGVNWLQFLREYHFGGILADDMGLGKTIQTLAHLSIEKKQGRLTKPSMIIAPTSVIYNWAAELEKFANVITYVLWHGDKRSENINKLKQVDLILTTYPLIVRDAKILLQQEYYFLILDEAQTIKNTQAKMTQIVQQFQAEYRLCLTGTPLENHLGELWSQFNFLMPGFLGSQEKFTTQYRTPIEKQMNTEVQAQLSLLIRPFMLRRTKKEVIQELPDKTEIIQMVELTKEQRDLYETIRLSMNKKIQQAIDEKGLERSQIIILDALLKLRQVCCHPKLLHMEGIKDIKKSAKLDALLELISEMVEEGRKILLFSQFTSMLSLIEDELVSMQIKFVKLTGSTKDRVTPINKFQQGNVPVFLISLKAGGTGLNLTTADTVIHFDPWWNPAAENQATDRAHRIGQKQAVFVYKFICKNTVEEKIIEMQTKKKALMDAIFTGGTHKGMITKEDLDVLFSGFE